MAMQIGPCIRRAAAHHSGRTPVVVGPWRYTASGRQKSSLSGSFYSDSPLSNSTPRVNIASVAIAISSTTAIIRHFLSPSPRHPTPPFYLLALRPTMASSSTLSSLFSTTLPIPPSCIEFVPGCREWCVVGTYFLEKGSEEEEREGGQKRSGSLVLLRLEGGEGEGERRV